MNTMNAKAFTITLLLAAAIILCTGFASAQILDFKSDSATLYTYDENSGWSNSVPTWTNPSWPSVGNGQWIWSSYHVTAEEAENGSGVSFKKIITLPADATNIHASITMDADNWFFLSLGNDFVGQNMDWQYPQSFDLNLHPGDNTLTVFVMNTPLNHGTWDTNPAGLVFSGEVSFDSGNITGGPNDPPTGQVPEFGIIAGMVAVIGGLGIVVSMRKQ